MTDLTLTGLSERIGQELGVSDWVAIDQARIDTSAKPRVRLEFCEETVTDRGRLGRIRHGAIIRREKATMLLCNQSDAGTHPALGA